MPIKVPEPVARDPAEDAWIARWLDAVTETSMTQRTLSSIEAHGGIADVVRAATRRGIHVIRLTDDRGTPLVAASRFPFEVLC